MMFVFWSNFNIYFCLWINTVQFVHALAFANISSPS